MNEPKRWSELTGGASQEESEILLAGSSERMPSELRGQVWSAITLAAAGGVAATASGAASVASTATVETAATASVASKSLALASSGVIKGALAIAVLGAVGVGAVQVRHWLRAPVSTQQLATHSGTVPREDASASGPELEHGMLAPGLSEGAPPVVGSAARAQTNAAHAPLAVPSSKSRSVPPASRTESENAPERATDASAASDVSSRLREESAAVLTIRRTLLAGNPREALSLLARARTEFPHGALAEEREALSVRALMAAGETEAARLRAAGFLRRFPRSPYAGDVRRLLGSQ